MSPAVLAGTQTCKQMYFNEPDLKAMARVQMMSKIETLQGSVIICHRSGLIHRCFGMSLHFNVHNLLPDADGQQT